MLILSLFSLLRPDRTSTIFVITSWESVSSSLPYLSVTSVPRFDTLTASSLSFYIDLAVCINPIILLDTTARRDAHYALFILTLHLQP